MNPVKLSDKVFLGVYKKGDNRLIDEEAVTLLLAKPEGVTVIDRIIELEVTTIHYFKTHVQTETIELGEDAPMKGAPLMNVPGEE